MTSIKPRSTSIVVYQGDDMEMIRDLRQKVEFAERQAKTANRAGDTDGVQEAKDAFDEGVRDASTRAVKIVVHALGRRAFRDLMAEHPPRKVAGEDGEEDHPVDAIYDVNVETFADALLTYTDGDAATIVEPEFPTAKACQRFLDHELSDGDYDSLFESAYWLNRNPAQDPKAVIYSAEPQSSTETSSSPARLG